MKYLGNIQKEQIYKKFIKVKALMHYITAINLACRYNTRSSIKKEVNTFCDTYCERCKNSVVIDKQHMCIIMMYDVNRISIYYSINDFRSIKNYLDKLFN